jgi:basic amino acid/polyamine antiporter, APA family
LTGTSQAEGLRPGLSLFDAAAIVAGSMIGSGIFIVSADITRRLESPAGLLMVWLVSGLMTVAGALAYGELAAMMPYAGGQYVFLREAYGEPPAFCYGWTLLFVIQTGTIAAVAVACARFGGVLWSGLGSRILFGHGNFGISGERLGAIAVIGLLTAVNLRGLFLGKLVQNAFTSAKVLALLMIVVLGCVIAPNHRALRANFGSARAFFGSGPLAPGLLAVFGAAMVGGLFSLDAWGNVTFTGSEVRNPRRDLARALALGTGAVVVLYVLTNVAYLCVLPALSANGIAQTPTERVLLDGIAGAAHDRVGSAAMSVVWGEAGATLTAILVMISTFGCANGLILTGARVTYAMVQDGLFPAIAGRLNRAAVPAVALSVQGVWAALLTLSGTYSELLDYVIFAQLLFYALTVSAVFILRWQRPDAPRPYRAWGYPIVPLVYILVALALMIDLLVTKPSYTWPGLIIAISAVPVYAWMARARRQVALS